MVIDKKLDEEKGDYKVIFILILVLVFLIGLCFVRVLYCKMLILWY